MKYSIKQRILAIVLTLTMIIPMLPVTSTHVHAAGTLTVTDANIGLSWTDASSSSGKASWTATGNTVTGTATGYKYLIMGRTITTKLTITNNHSDDRTLSFDYTLTGGGSVSGIISGTSGSYSNTLAAGASATITLTSPSGTSTNTLTISGLALLSAGNLTSTFLAPENGSYTVDGEAVTAQTTKEKATTEAYALNATPASGYMFFGWYSQATDSYVSYDAETSQKFGSDPQLKPVFVPATTALFGVGAAKFSDLTEAANYASTATTKTVVLLNNGTVSGSHTVPAGVTLLIPYNDANTVHGATPETSQIPDGTSTSTAQLYRKLTLVSNTTITVNGAIEVGSQHYTCHGGKTLGGTPVGGYGQIEMGSGSQIVLENGANLYAWGYITGLGSVTAKPGAKISEMMSVADYPGGSFGENIISENVFPFNQYYIQNVEVPSTIHSGATLVCWASVYNKLGAILGDPTKESSVDFMGGSSSMFALGSGTTVTKRYDAATDRLILDVNGDITMNAISIMDYDTSDFILPLNQNMTININSGTANISQDVMLQPGARINVANDATLMLAEGKLIYLMDAASWGNFCFAAKTKQIAFVGSRAGKPVVRTLTDSILDINGTLEVSGTIYAASAATQITSSDKTGFINFLAIAPGESTVKQCDVTSGSVVTVNVAVAAPYLTNGDGTTISTSGTAAGTTYQYCSEHDQWYTDECEKCNAGFTVTWIVNGEQVEVDEDVTGIPEFDGTITVPEGMHFSGWDAEDDGEVDISIGAPTADMTIVAIFENCYDNNNDHKCDRADCGKTLSQCADNDKNHKCDECGETTSTCEDKTGDGDHNCDLCGEALSQCADKTGDGDHKCDECGNDNVSEHTGNAPVNENFEEATCTTAGKYDSVVYCSECNAEMSRTNVTVDPLEHDWNAPSYTWSEDGKTCTAERTCKHDGTHKETETVTASGVITTPANCVEMGTTTYTADFDAEWAVDGQTTTRQDVAINDDHDYQITYTDDGVTHTINYVCSRNSSHTKSESGKSHNYGDDLVCDECGNEKIVSGDIDGNGIVELSDVTEFARYLAGWDIDCNEAVLDVNGDGKVNLNDLVHLAQYVAGWENIVLH